MAGKCLNGLRARGRRDKAICAHVRAQRAQRARVDKHSVDGAQRPRALAAGRTLSKIAKSPHMQLVHMCIQWHRCAWQRCNTPRCAITVVVAKWARRLTAQLARRERRLIFVCYLCVTDFIRPCAVLWRTSRAKTARRLAARAICRVHTINNM